MGNLEHVVMEDEVWASITMEMLTGGEAYGMERQAEYYGQRIVDHVAQGVLTVDDLRNCVRWANDLNRQTINEANGTGDSSHLGEDDRTEVLARRVLHASTKTALEAVKSRRRLQSSIMDYGNRWELLRAEAGTGMFQREAKDLGLDDLVVAREQGTLDERMAA